MIDTVKILTKISNKVADVISETSKIKMAFNRATGVLEYEIITSSLEGSYSSSLSCRVDDAERYGLGIGKVLILEGSYHKISKGQNAYGGYWDVSEVCRGLIELVEFAYKIKLPKIRHWFLQRIDITNCYDLSSNIAVCQYINNLSKCQYPKRKLRFFDDESLYVTGKSTTLKIYNKLLEFRKNDLPKMKKNDFDYFAYQRIIEGFVRFECEIHKKKLCSHYNGSKLIRVSKVDYDDLEGIWRDEFMKLLKLFNNDMSVVRTRDAVQRRLVDVYGETTGGGLYNFYLLLVMEGQKTIKNRMSKPTYYRKLKMLKDASVDFTQSDIKVDFDETGVVDFDPFSYPKVV